MATAVDFPKRNDYIGKPPTMTDNQCYALPVLPMKRLQRSLELKKGLSK